MAEVYWCPSLAKRALPRRGGVAPRLRKVDVEAAWGRVVDRVNRRADLLVPRRTADEPCAELLNHLLTRLRDPCWSRGTLRQDAALLALLSVPIARDDRDRGTPMIEALVADRGVPRATRTGLEALRWDASGVRGPRPQEGGGPMIAHARAGAPLPVPRAACALNLHGLTEAPQDPRPWLGGCALDDQWWPWLARLRARIAQEPDPTPTIHAVEEAWPTFSAGQRAVAAFLIPERRDWVDEAIATWRTGHGFLPVFLAATRVDDLAVTHLAWTHAAWLNPTPETSLAVSLIDTFGVAALPLILPPGAGRAPPTVWQLCAALPDDRALDALFATTDDEAARSAIVTAVTQQPERALRRLPAAWLRSRHPLLRQQLEAVAQRGPIDQVVAGLPQDEADLLRSIAPQERPAVAKDVPASVVLATRPRRPEPPFRHATPPRVEVQQVWREGERETWANTPTVMPIAPARPADWYRAEQAAGWTLTCWDLPNAPAEVVEDILPGIEAPRAASCMGIGKVVAARHGVAALPYLQRCFRRERESPFGLPPVWLPPIGHPDLAVVFLYAFQRAEDRHIAEDWMARHPRQAIAGVLALLPALKAKDRRAAVEAIRNLAVDHRAAIEEIAAPVGLGPWVAWALSSDATRSTFHRSSAIDVGRTPLLLSRDRGALPIAAVGAFCDRICADEVEDAVVRVELEPASAARFAADLFHQWMAQGSPTADAWVVNAVGLLGDDDCATQLASCVHRLPADWRPARAAQVVDALARIGTDHAIAELHRVALEVPSALLRERAKEKVNAALRTRGLADRA